LICSREQDMLKPSACYRAEFKVKFEGRRGTFYSDCNTVFENRKPCLKKSREQYEIKMDFSHQYYCRSCRRSLIENSNG